MKKIIIGVLVIAGLIYLYLVLAVEDDKQHFKEGMKNQPDSIRINDSTYHFRNIDSLKK
ncbi:MAG TPA: hypothetical protein VF476_06595 [Chitinophagaceae bacterium]